MAFRWNTFSFPRQVSSLQENPALPFVTPEMFGAKGDGITNDGPAYVAAFATGCLVTDVPGKTYLISSTVNIPTNGRYFGGGTIKSGGSNLIKASGDDIVIENMVIDQNGSQGLLASTGNRNILKGGRSFGNCTGSHVAFSGNQCQILNVVIDGSQSSGTEAALLFDVATDYLVDGVFVYDTTGFAMQFRNTVGTSAKNSGGRVTNCTVVSPVRSQSITSAGQTVFNFTLPTACGRPGIQINGVPTTTGSVSGGFVITTADSIHFTVTFGSMVAAAKVVTLLAWRSLEAINVNSLVQDLVISNCTLDGGGDGGVVFGDDYSLGSPSGCVVIGNVIKNMADSGISEDSAACAYNTFRDNDILDCCLTTDDFFFASGIAWQGGPVDIGGGSIRNTGLVPTIKYGVTCNGAGISSADVGLVDKPCNLSSIVFGSDLVVGWHLEQESTSFLMGNINLAAQPMFTYLADPMADITAAWGAGGPPTVGVPVSSTFLTYAIASGAGWTRQTSGTLNGTACIQTIASASGSIVLVANHLMDSSLFEILFRAKANSGSSFVQVFAQIGGSFPFQTATITSTNWTDFRLCIPLLGAARLYQILIGSTSGTALIDGLRFGYRPYS